MQRGYRNTIVGLVCLMLGSTPALADPPPVSTIVQQIKAAIEPPQPTTRKLVITARNATGEKVQWGAAQAFKNFPSGQHLVTVILSPEEVSGHAFLVQERTDEPSELWVYSPTVQRVRGFESVHVYEHFLGTDYTYTDLSFLRVHGHYRLLGQEQHNGVQAYKVEEATPADQTYYSQLVIWAAVDSLLPLQRDYYDVTGALWKTELFEEVTVVGGISTPMRITMRDHRAQTSTTLRLAEVRYDTEVPDELFDPEQLPDLASHPIWQEANLIAYR